MTGSHDAHSADPASAPAHKPHRSRWMGALGGAGLFVLAMVFVLGGIDLGVGSARRLGTGAFPVLSGLALALLSLCIILGDLRDPPGQDRPDWVSFTAIGAALAVFALVAEPFGLVPAVFLATVTASLPDRSLHWAIKPVLGIGVALASWGLFIGLLDLPFQSIKGF